MLDWNPWGLTSVLTAVVACLFAMFLARTAVPTPVTRRFTVLLLVEPVTLLTSNAGLYLLTNNGIPASWETPLTLLHHLADVLMLTLYPMFVATALPIRGLKILLTVPGRVSLYGLGAGIYAWLLLDHMGMITSSIRPDSAIYLMLVIMFVAILVVSLLGVHAASTKLAREKALAFACAFGIRDLAWASVYFAALTGFIGKHEAVFNQIYAGSTLIYIPLVTYGILKMHLLDIEIRMRATVRNTILASGFVAAFYVISEGTSAFISNQLGEILGFIVCAVLAVFLAPLQRWAERFAERIVQVKSDAPGYVENRGLQIYSAAVEEALSYGDIDASHVALLDRLKSSLQIADADAKSIEKGLRAARSTAARGAQ